MNEMERFGKLIDDGMRERGLVGYQLAAMLGKQQSWLSRILNGQIKNVPTQEELRALSNTLGIPVRRMLEAMNYLDPAELEPGIAFVVSEGDPRARLLDLLDGEPDAGVEKVIELVQVLGGVLSGYGRNVATASQSPKGTTNSTKAG